MDQPVTKGDYAPFGDATYLIIQTDALANLPTVIGLPAQRQAPRHRPPLVLYDQEAQLWIHTYAPATLWRADLGPPIRRAATNLIARVETGIVAILGLSNDS